ncbi:MAG: hypothetical protein KBF92_08685 [Bacteroidia bacterium]|nr:hypothetical protein [Bacteroidota bacterium]MBP9923892.1 hypothetical protein [Bacteroidia bacterium]HQW96588.1 hypothetical protein [Saprospiraceae bacterium]
MDEILKYNKMTENKNILGANDSLNDQQNESNLAGLNSKENVGSETLKKPVVEDDEEEGNDQGQGSVSQARDSGRVRNLIQRRRPR